MEHAGVGTAPTDDQELLRQHGLRRTAQRLAVLRAVSARSHATADEVFGRVTAELGAISRQAVYDVLATMTEKDILRRIEPAGSSARYERRVGDNHHHLICRICSRLVDVDCAAGKRPCLEPSDAAGFEIDEAEVVYWGRCPECAAPPARTTASTTHQRRRTTP